MPWNIWLSELSVQLAIVTLGSAAHGVVKSHRYLTRCLRSDDPFDWGWVAQWRRVHRINTVWLVVTVLLLAFQLRIHLFQVGLLPAPGR